MDRSMRVFVNMDSVLYVCPCGASEEGEGDVIGRFVTRHRDHTDGTAVDTVTDDGMRAYAVRPAPRRRVL